MHAVHTGALWRKLASGSLGLATVAALLAPLAAHADVKAGVDAWTNGDYAAAVREWEGPAAKGDPDAQFNMAQAYKLGRGVPLDLERAETLYLAAAKAGHARAADNYGILLFQTNRQADAIPWLTASAERGEPRAMYVLGIAAYNGDFVERDWVRAYALMTRASASGLQQALTSLGAMNEAIPIEQRQQGAALAIELEKQAEATRSRQLGGADLGTPARPAVPVAPVPAPAPSSAPRALQTVDLPAAQTQPPVAAPKPVPAPAPAPAQTAPAPKPAPGTVSGATGGTWRIQFGAFGVKANADALWARLRVRPEVSGHPRIDAGTTITRLMAGGYSEAAATRACASLQQAGFVCLVVRP